MNIVMNIDQNDIVKNGEITIESIFQLDGMYGITALLQECLLKNCTVHFRNEDLTITPEQQNDVNTRAIINTYDMIMAYPKAARDFVNYAFDTAARK